MSKPFDFLAQREKTPKKREPIITNLTPELITKARTAKTVEQLIAIAQDNNVEYIGDAFEMEELLFVKYYALDAMEPRVSQKACEHTKDG